MIERHNPRHLLPSLFTLFVCSYRLCNASLLQPIYTKRRKRRRSSSTDIRTAHVAVADHTRLRYLGGTRFISSHSSIRDHAVYT